MRRILTIAALALAAVALLVPAAAQARSHSSASADRNHDRIPDRWEKRHRLSLRVKQTRLDQDHDGLNNLAEFRDGTDPRNADTDHDGIRDGAEHRFGMDPRHRDSDHDGINDGEENAGRVQSFEGGVLTIALAAGGTVSGKVVDGTTEIQCRSATPTAQATRDGEGDHSGSSDNSGPGSGDQTGDHSGDEQGENENEPGEDRNDQGENEPNGANCSSADLTPNTMVHEAELNVTSTGAVFREIKLVK